MDRVVGKKTGQRYSLGPRALVGQGVEGKVYRCGDSCVKVLASPLKGDDTSKIAALVALSTRVDGFAWPTEIVTDPATGEDVGVTMKFVPGESLESVLDARATGTIPFETKLRLALRVSLAVAAAHAHSGPRLVLGDVVKAGNVVIDGDQATFVDTVSATLFGFRVPSGDVRDAISPLTTPGYVPKEVLEHPRALPSEAADRFALAVLLFELLFGRSPHDVRPCPASMGLEPDDMVRQGIYPRWIQHSDFDPPTYDPVALPAEVDQLFRAAFLSNVRPSALEWSGAFEGWLRALPHGDPLRRRRKPRPRWLRRLDPVSVTFVLIVALAYLVRLAWSNYTAERPPEVRVIPPAPSRPVGPPLFQELFR
jgi:DNA-binding helix-hairpin-helix protein with protein kinase domain